MAEFEKRRTLKAEEVFANISEYGQLRLGNSEKGIPMNSQFVAEIVGELQKEDSPDGELTFYSFPVKYHCKGYNPEYVEFKTYVAGKKADKLIAEHPDYIGKKVIFGKGRLGVKLFHVLAVVKQENEVQEFTIPKKIEELHKEVSEAKPTGSIQKDAPLSKTPDVPEELNSFVTELLENIDTFKDAFVDTDVLNGKRLPIEFMTWFADKEQSGTNYVDALKAKGVAQQTIDEKVLALFWGIMAKVEGNK